MDGCAFFVVLFEYVEKGDFGELYGYHPPHSSAFSQGCQQS
jgi:hypothetical protein